MVHNKSLDILLIHNGTKICLELRDDSSSISNLARSMKERRGFTMPPKNKKARQDPSQDTPKHAKQLNGEMLYTYLALCKRELDTSKDAGSGLSKASSAKIREEYNAKFNITREPKYFSNVWFYQKQSTMLGHGF
ncbi:hypothetical protein GIB67_032203 [Kingdonia uniflora]|uniref:Uncharacterized protein n=1 Tax=Kingdonia uniflora TaxID=39325 RepID=A0A7J7MXC3_9MAGN|nr:hypothetical protein GIB67_032203 [Kingdonia uniflora]